MGLDRFIVRDLANNIILKAFPFSKINRSKDTHFLQMSIICSDSEPMFIVSRSSDKYMTIRNLNR